MPDLEGASPLDAAIESIQRGDLGGEPVNAEDTAEDPFSLPLPEPEPVAKPRGRPRKPDSRRARSGVYAGKAKASGPVKDPPIPEVKPDFPRIAPESVTQSIKQLDAIIVKLAGTAPLTGEEATSGGVVFAPVLDHYMPLLAEKGGVWLAPFTWVVLAYGPRAYEVLERRQKMLEAKKRGYTAPPEAQPGEESGKTTFPASDDTGHVRPFSLNGE